MSTARRGADALVPPRLAVRAARTASTCRRRRTTSGGARSARSFRGGRRERSAQIRSLRLEARDARATRAASSRTRIADVAITKTVIAGERPFELERRDARSRTSPTRRRSTSSTSRCSRFARTSEVKGSLGRVSPFATELECARDNDVSASRRTTSRPAGSTMPLVDRWVAVNNYYFVQASCRRTARSRECGCSPRTGSRRGKPADDDARAPSTTRSSTYPPRELAAAASATYKQIAFFGPKEREVLAQAAGGRANLGDAINLGFFSPVAKFLVGVLRVLPRQGHEQLGPRHHRDDDLPAPRLFPLHVQADQDDRGDAQAEARDRRCSNARFKDDTQAKKLAMMEL